MRIKSVAIIFPRSIDYDCRISENYLLIKYTLLNKKIDKIIYTNNCLWHEDLTTSCTRVSKKQSEENKAGQIKMLLQSFRSYLAE